MRFPDESGRPLVEAVRRAPAGAVIQLAPGRYQGPLRIDRALTLRGAGDLTRIMAPPEGGSVVSVEAPAGQVRLESLLFEGGHASGGGGLRALAGEVSLFNLQIRNCRAEDGGGGIYVGGSAEVEGERLRLLGVRAEYGGAVAVRGAEAVFRLFDAELRGVEARRGGAVSVEGGAHLDLEAVTVLRARASSIEGGQVLWVSGPPRSSVHLHRVRFGDSPVGRPVVNDAEAPGRIVIEDCDLPRWVRDTPGIVIQGETRWR